MFDDTVDARQPVYDALFSVPAIVMPTVQPSAKVVGGASGVAQTDDQKGGHELETKLALKYGQAGADRMLQIIKQDLKDGSTVNTNTLTEKWVANTGLSKLVLVNGRAQLFDGLALPVDNANLIFDQAQTRATLNALSQAAFGHAPGH
jgi:hypothetical protein